MLDKLQHGLINRPDDLRRLVEVLIEQPIVGVDTESNSLFAFREQVCLIQFSTPQADYLVDPLILADLSPLGTIFANPNIEKVFHAAEYDILCLKRDFDFQFANLFDTMLSARILGRQEIGLSSLVSQEFGIVLDKRGQRANWGQRPLPESLITYARQDTHYLIPLRQRLGAALEERGLLPLAQEDFRRLCALEASLPEGDAENIWRISGARDLTSQQAAVLQELCIYRARVARMLDRPLFKVFGDKTLLTIAVNCPGSLAELSQIPGMSRGQVRRHGQAILQAVRRGLEARPLIVPRPSRADEETLSRVDALREWRKEQGRAMGLESDVILPRDLIWALAEQNPPDAEHLAKVMASVPWRLQRFGGQILDVLHRASR